MMREKNVKTSVRNLVLLSVFIYIVWVFATYMLEGRINLFHTDDTLGRILYVAANIAIGIVLSAAVLRHSIRSGITNLEKIGLRTLLRTIIFVIISGVVSFGIFIVQKPVSLNPTVVLNVFAQVLPISIAEVVVCWAVIGTSFEALSKKGGKIVSLIVGIVIADVLFGIYHFAHSAPFNQLNMVFFLMIPGLGTSLVYFLARDLYSTIVFQNFMAALGVMQNINLSVMKEPLYPIYAIALISLLILVCFDIFFIRRWSMKPLH
jgi:hypothetical protein